VNQQELMIERRKTLGRKTRERFRGLNLGFTKDGLTQLIGPGRPNSIRLSSEAPMIDRPSRA
jgi:hypothetical protein